MLVKKTKHFLIKNRVPPKDFQFPSNHATKTRDRSTGGINRYCQLNWFTEFDFITYSFHHDGSFVLYCMCSVFIQNIKENKPCVLLTKPCRNWKDMKSDLKSHSVTEAHFMAKAKTGCISVNIYPI